MKNSKLPVVMLMITLFACQSKLKEDHVVFIIENESNIDLFEKALLVPREKLVSDKENEQPILLTENNDTVPAQRSDMDGNGEWDNLFFLMDLPGQTEKRLTLHWTSESLNWEERTYVRFGVRPSEEDTVRPMKKHTFYPHMLPGVMGYQPYQTDGPSWENDKVGFRHYLDGRNSKDVFGKKQSKMSPRNVGINQEGVTEDNYHVMEDWGRDILSVGTSVGIGGFSLMIDNRVVRLGVTQRDSLNNVAKTIFNVVESGPLFSLTQTEYKDWKPEETDRVYQVSEQTEIWPGFYGYQNTVRFQQLRGDEKGVIGLVNINTDKPLSIMEKGKFTILYTHDKQTYDKEWYLGLALIIPSDIYRGWEMAPKEGQLTDSFLAVVNVNEGTPLTYYSVAAWEMADPGFREEKYFKEYLLDLSEQLSIKPKITIKKN
ncbi:DUF4861 domain-containing protein [Echinicola sp. 20G]|uniref:DUF4861 domain-containing protein n=1 Tax=Echinicola sp. 20G TaxID=2781961 RepID=UPI001910527B|nr:DUF4861 domain-containing protein [Echinicola sp. 20G]